MTGCYTMEFIPGLNDTQRNVIKRFNDHNQNMKRSYEHKESISEIHKLHARIDSLTMELNKCQ